MQMSKSWCSSCSSSCLSLRGVVKDRAKSGSKWENHAAPFIQQQQNKISKIIKVDSQVRISIPSTNVPNFCVFPCLSDTNDMRHLEFVIEFSNDSISFES